MQQTHLGYRRERPSLRNFDVERGVGDDTVLTWLIHPGLLDGESVSNINDFLSYAYGKDARIFMDTPEFALPEELKENVERLEDSEQLYWGGWAGNDMPSKILGDVPRHKRSLSEVVPEHQNLVMGGYLENCVKSHINYLDVIEVPGENITVLAQCSALGDPRNKDKIFQHYRDRDIQVYEGYIQDLDIFPAEEPTATSRGY